MDASDRHGRTKYEENKHQQTQIIINVLVHTLMTCASEICMHIYNTSGLRVNIKWFTHPNIYNDYQTQPPDLAR